jgi:hypothetical protein
VAQVTAEEESVQVDDYLNALLAGRFAGPRSVGTEDDIDPELEATAGLVQRALSRFHPSFAFEEWLSARLAAAAMAQGGEMPHVAALPEPVALRQRVIAGLAEDRHPRQNRLSNGAIASGVSIAGMSIAGAALLVRRRTRTAAHHPAEAGA